MDAKRTAIALLVDDDPSSRRENQARLEGEGYWVVLAVDQADALNRVKQSAPNVIFVHLVASGAGSLPFMQALRAEDQGRHIPVVVITGHDAADVLKRKLRAVHHEGW